MTKKSKACETVDTPSSWQQWSQSMDPVPELLTKKTVPGSADVRLLVVNYESVFQRVPGDPKSKRRSSAPPLVPFIKEFVNSCKFKRVCLFLDESHCIKDPSTSQAKALKQFKLELKCVAKDLRAYLLTGTPFTKELIDVWNQLKFLGCPMTKTEFKDRFCILGNVRGLLGWQQPIVGYRDLDGLYKLIHQYAVTVKSSDVLPLPQQIFSEHVIPESPYFRWLTTERVSEAALRDFAKSTRSAFPAGYKPFTVSKNKVLNPFFRNFSFPDDDWLADTPGTLYLRARQLSIGFQGNGTAYKLYTRARFDAIRRFLEERPGNYVLFYNYVPEFLELFEIVTALGYNVDVYNGEIKSLHFFDKYSAQSQEQRLLNDKNVILSNFASGSTGMNWQLYHECIVASLPVYRDWAQGLKRIHRNGSIEPVTYHVFYEDNWLDRKMREALNARTDFTTEMFEEGLKNVVERDT